jgi:hypothetical protein
MRRVPDRIDVRDMGRPPKPPEEKTTRQLGLRLTDEHFEMLDELAKALDVPAAEVLRIAMVEMHARWKRRR